MKYFFEIYIKIHIARNLDLYNLFPIYIILLEFYTENDSDTISKRVGH